MALDGSTGMDPSGGPQSSPGGALDIGIQLHQFGIKGALLMLLAQKKTCAARNNEMGQFGKLAHFGMEQKQ
jgi:hypothetical protein